MITLLQDDFGQLINFTIQNSTGTAFDLTGYTVRLKVWTPSDSRAMRVNSLCTITNPPGTDGLCTYVVKSGDFPTRGQYKGELEIIGTSYKESTRAFEITVEESG